MALPNIFKREITDQLIQRVNQLKPDSQPQWGKMNVAQMLAHCNVAYELVYENKHPKPNPFIRLMLKLFVKNKVVGEAPYPRNSMTAPVFKMVEDKHFESEKQRMIAYLEKTQRLGESHFTNKKSDNFGALTIQEWSNMFYKHLDHHLKQFGQ